MQACSQVRQLSDWMVFYDLIMVSSILKSLTAFKACGSWAGIIMISPCFRWNGFPEILISTSPLRT
jgi:hypothetical protein